VTDDEVKYLGRLREKFAVEMGKRFPGLLFVVLTGIPKDKPNEYRLEAAGNMQPDRMTELVEKWLGSVQDGDFTKEEISTREN
jgi:hypothetical protein